SGHFDYSIEEQLDQKTSTEQMVIDVETITVNLSKILIELDSYGIQNESEKGDSTPKGSETTRLRIEELPKLLSSYKKENYIANPTLMEINPNKDSSEINMKINLMQEDEITVPGKQTDIPNETLARQIRKNLSFYSRLTNNRNAEGKRIVMGSNTIKIINRRGFSSLGDNIHFEKIKPIKNLFVGLKGKAKIEIESNKTYSKTALSQKVPQINMLLQEILKRLETVENNQSVLLVTDKVNPSTRSLAHPRS
ncbi:3608_t:CDS:2, partial [Gigaspora margarita]